MAARISISTAWCEERAKPVHSFTSGSPSATGTSGDDLVRSLREAEFKLYIESLLQLVPWFFSLDHTHYARRYQSTSVTWSL